MNEHTIWSQKNADLIRKAIALHNDCLACRDRHVEGEEGIFDALCEQCYDDLKLYEEVHYA